VNIIAVVSEREGFIMAHAQNVRLLSRSRNLQLVCDACRAPGPIVFDDIVQLITAKAPRRVVCDCHAARDHILLIASTWDLDHRLLDEQSDECLSAIVAFIS
jgi:hypothetical protein